MGDIRSHRDLIAWQKAMDLACEVRSFVAMLPKEERFGLASQLRRASVSVPSNIAEGYGRGSRADYVRFLRAARGSLYEMDTQALLCVRCAYVSESAYRPIVDRINECGRILAALIRSVQESESR